MKARRLDGRCGRWRRLTWTAGFIYSAALLLVAGCVHFLGDAWGPATPLLFGPRLLFLAPLPLLAAAALWFEKRVLLVAAFCGAVGLFLVADFRLPVRSLWRAPSSLRLRILTINADGAAMRIAALGELLKDAEPDVVAMQESPNEGLESVFPAPPWTLVRGERGVLIASRIPVFESRRPEPTADLHGGTALVVFLDHPATQVRFACVHLPTPRAALETLMKSHYRNFNPLAQDLLARDRASQEVHAFVAEGSGPLIVAGDFNLPRESRIFRNRWGGLNDAFAEAGFGLGCTKFTRWHGVSIDHVLCDRDWVVDACYVGPDVGSDHRPVLCELGLRVDVGAR